MSIGLTQVQASTLSFLRDYRDEKGVMPSFAEIADHLGYKSKSRIYDIMTCLEERGAVRRLHARARAVELVDQSETRSVTVSADLWPLLIRYCIAEGITAETAVNALVRNEVEGPWAK